MTPYDIALSLHILAAIGIVGGSCLELFFHARMRSARTHDILLEWLSAAGKLSKAMPIFSVVVLVCGVYMTFAHWDWQQPWIVVSLALLVVIGAAAPTVLEPRLRAVGKAAQNGAPLALTASLLRKPALTIPGHIFPAEAVAIVILMASKPALPVTVIVVVIAAAIGAIVGVWPRGRQAAFVQSGGAAQTAQND